jgi:hypothetical protein
MFRSLSLPSAGKSRSSRDRQTDGSPRRVVREKDPMLKMRNSGNGSKSSKEQEEEAQRKKTARSPRPEIKQRCIIAQIRSRKKGRFFKLVKNEGTNPQNNRGTEAEKTREGIQTFHSIHPQSLSIHVPLSSSNPSCPSLSCPFPSLSLPVPLTNSCFAPLLNSR